MNHTYYIGLDVHKETVAVAWAGPEGQPQFHGNCASSLRTVEDTLRRLAKKLGTGFKELKVTYEAGPTGFVLARRLRQLGIAVTVVAPSLIPRGAGERIKTDRRDALKLARLHRAGELTAVHIPDGTDEAIRDLCRARTDAVDDMHRAKRRMSSFLLRNGHHYTGKGKWGTAHLKWLREVPFAEPAQKVVLEEYIRTIEQATASVARLEAHMEQLLANWERRNEVAAVMALKGFKTVGAMIIVSELGDLGRFSHPRQLMGFLGLVPGEHSSGGKRRQGGITKCGNNHARWMLVEAAHSYRLPPKVSAQLTERQHGQSREIKELSWRAQNRLSGKYRKLVARGLHRNKAVTAVARELAGFLWELHRICRCGKLPA
jgi:transposase